ncbi:MAG: hypothetical protein GX685_00235, partial [Clostridiales bacterium]|nr:hypothetical protein [Clostridiales bacterium]
MNKTKNSFKYKMILDLAMVIVLSLLFRKNTLDEMTVGRTEKPVKKDAPAKPDVEALTAKALEA